MSKGAPKGQRQLWTPERIDKLSARRIDNWSYARIAGDMSVSVGSVAGACDRYLNRDGTVRSYARLSVPRPKYNAPIEELQAPKVHRWRDESAHTRKAPPPFRSLAHGSVQHPSTARITLPRVSIQRRDDFTDADVRAGSADRAWTERAI